MQMPCTFALNWSVLLSVKKGLGYESKISKMYLKPSLDKFRRLKKYQIKVKLYCLAVYAKPIKISV